MPSHRHLIDYIVWGLTSFATGVEVVGINTILTGIAITVSIILGCIRVHDRLTYGPSRNWDDD